MRLLIIEDERRTAAHLQKGLSENGFTVDVAYDGCEGFELARTGDYALIVLDVMLPHRDGWTILDELRRANVMTPVLFLTARDRVEDRIKGLEMGADDYLVKPFSYSEIVGSCPNRFATRPGNAGGSAAYSRSRNRYSSISGHPRGTPYPIDPPRVPVADLSSSISWRSCFAY
jgi:DNA-binding response OmpR family regulator